MFNFLFQDVNDLFITVRSDCVTLSTDLYFLLFNRYGRKGTKHPQKLSLYTILCKCLFSEVTVEAVTELDDKTAHCHAPVPQRHRPFL